VGTGEPHFRTWLTTRGARRVPEITVAFWLIKGLTTAMGEATSDDVVGTIAPAVAVGLGTLCLLGALALQFRMGRYLAWTYWLAVVMVGIVGTMAADVLHKGLGVPYTGSTLFYAAVLAAVFVAWRRTEHTLSIHSIDTPRREAFYWAAVVATFAMGTALGDFTATTLHLGYLTSAVVFAVLIAVPGLGFRWLGWNGVATFWAAYVLTRPLGASVADYLGKPASAGGLGWGDGTVALLFGVLILIGVTYLAVTRVDVRAGTGPGVGDPSSQAA
jgi:uncharacterized membrane-anchored protein